MQKYLSRPLPPPHCLQPLLATRIIDTSPWSHIQFGPPPPLLPYLYFIDTALLKATFLCPSPCWSFFKGLLLIFVLLSRPVCKHVLTCGPVSVPFFYVHCFLASFLPWRWRQYLLPKCLKAYFYRIRRRHLPLNSLLMVTTGRNLNPRFYKLIYLSCNLSLFFESPSDPLLCRHSTASGEFLFYPLKLLAVDLNLGLVHRFVWGQYSSEASHLCTVCCCKESSDARIRWRPLGRVRSPVISHPATSCWFSLSWRRWADNIKTDLKEIQWAGMDWINLKSIILWDMTPCSPLSFNRRFGGTYRLHLQGPRNKLSKKPASKQGEDLKSYLD
jgi:hypothetical protein